MGQLRIYHGDLKELNSRGKDKYRFGDKHYFCSGSHLEWTGVAQRMEAFDEMLGDISQEGYEGLVNAHISRFPLERQIYIYIQGTPIVKVKR